MYALHLACIFMYTSHEHYVFHVDLMRFSFKNNCSNIYLVWMASMMEETIDSMVVVILLTAQLCVLLFHSEILHARHYNKVHLYNIINARRHLISGQCSC